MKAGSRRKGLRIVVDFPFDASACMGTGAYSEAMVRALAAAAPDSRIILAVSVGHPRRIRLPNVEYSSLPETDGLGEGTRQVALPAFLAASGADCLFAPASLVPCVKVCPTVATVHDLTFETHADQYAPTLVDYLKRWFPSTLAAADRIVAISDPVREGLVSRKEVDPERVVVIEQPIRETFRQALSREAVARGLEGLGIREPYFFHVSNLGIHKNMEFGVRMLAEYLRRKPTARHQLLFAGGGFSPSRPPDLIQIARGLGIGDRVRYVGKVSDELLKALYQGCEAFVFPSLAEGWGLPVVEARALGARVLASPHVPSALPEERLPLDVGLWIERLHLPPMSRVDGGSQTPEDAGHRLLATIEDAIRASEKVRPATTVLRRSDEPRVMILGDWYSPSGFGQAGRGVYQALELARMRPVASLVPKDAIQDKRLWRGKVTLVRGPADISIHHLPPENMDLSLPGKHAGFFFWETDRVPERSREVLSRLDEIWSPSSFVAEVLKRSGVTVPVVNVSPPVDTELYAPGAPRSPLIDLPSEFDPSWTVFLYVGTWDPRKRPDVLVRSFTKSFSQRDRALLLIKSYVTGNPAKDREILSAWIEEARVSDAHVKSIAGVLSAPEMADLFRLATAFATASRGEGYCLPAVQAMSTGKPVIATGWSAFRDYVTFPVEYEVRPVPAEVNLPGYSPGHQWAEIDEGDLGRKLRWVHDHPGEVRLLGQKARSWVLENASMSVVGHRLKARILDLCKIPVPPQPEEVLS
jgi:glycosyltransferase involved in cell wall biosynthesis